MIQGSCLCGAVRWQFEGQPDGATACNCTACRRYGVLWAYDYEDEGIKISGKTQAYFSGARLSSFTSVRFAAAYSSGADFRRISKEVEALYRSFPMGPDWSRRRWDTGLIAVQTFY